jgi:phosphoribosylanthranilate isomerase
MMRSDDALAAVALGVDAIGLIFAPQSKRCLDLPQAVAITRGLPPFVQKVALFLDPEVSQVAAVLAAVAVDVLQFHGGEDAAFCRQFARPYLKAVAMGEGPNLPDIFQRFPDAAAFVLDAHQPGQSGGTGRRFDWSLIPANPTRPLVLAGGLHPGNVADAIHAVRPYAVDVASGIEASVGHKDYAKMHAFVTEVARADQP